MQLAAAGIERINTPRATRDEEVGKSAGRCTDIEADAARGIEPEMIKRRRKLDPAARDEGVRRLRAQHGIDGDLGRRLGDEGFIRHHPAGRNGSLRLGAAFEQAALHQETVDPHAARPDARLDTTCGSTDLRLDNPWAGRSYPRPSLIASPRRLPPKASKAFATMPLVSSP